MSQDILGIPFSKNAEQCELIRLINTNNTPIVFCMGDAGTGKTFTALAAAIKLTKIDKKYRRIFYIREPIEVGRSLGFLPGDIDDKFSVYLDGLFDNLEHISEYSGINVNDMKAAIECIPPQFIRSRSLESAIILVDESQNLTLEEIQTICTRLGKYCKLVFLGSLKQIDLRGMTSENNDFLKSYNILANNSNTADLIGYVELVKSERSEYCKKLDEAFNEYKLSLKK